MNGTATETVIDVRSLPPRDRHATIFNTWHALVPEGSLVVVNDHDPVPLYYQFACEHTGTFRWDYLERGPETWRVRLTKGRFADPGFTPNARMARPEPVSAPATEPLVLDVRPIFARGETPCAAIDDAVARTRPGQTLVLLVPFEPVPLYAKLGNAGFSHQSFLEEDGTWRIEFRRGTAASAAPMPCCCGHD